MMNLDAMEESGRLERGDRETTITTNVAGTEQMTRTGHWHNQIPGAHVETELEESGETSRKYDCFGHTVTSNMTAEPEKDCGNGIGDLEIDLSASQEFDDVIHGEQKIKEHEDVANATSPADARSDQPASISDAKNEETRPTKSSLQKVLVDTMELEQQSHAVDPGTSTSAITEEDAQNGDIDASMSGMGELDENVPTIPSATIDCTTVSDPISDYTTFQSPTNERQRPTRVTDRPSRYRDSAFETQFQPTLRRRNCRKIQTKSRTGSDITNERECQDLGRGERKQKVSPTENGVIPSISEQTTQEPTPTDRAKLQGIASQKRQPKVGRPPSFITNFHQHPSGKIPAEVQSSRNDRYYHTPSGHRNKNTGDSRNSPKMPHLKEKNYTRHQTSSNREPAVADSDDPNEFLIASTTTTYNWDSTYDRPDALCLKFRSIQQMAPPAALRKLNHVVGATHREADVDAQAMMTIKRQFKQNCRSSQKDPDDQYRTNDQWDIARPWKRKKPKQLGPHFNANSATIHFSMLPKKFQKNADRN